MKTSVDDKNIKRVGILLRVSTDMQVNKNIQINQNGNNEPDLPMQREECRKFIESKKHEGWVLAKEYREVGSSYKISWENRDKIGEIISDIEAGEIDVILFFMIDRFARSSEALAPLAYMNMMGAEIWSTREGKMSFEKHIDLLINFINLWRAEGESKNISERVIAAMNLMGKKGEYIGGRPPYGYKAVETGKYTKKRIPERTFAIDEDEAKIVRIMFDLAIKNGYGCHRIAQHLNQQGLRTKTGKQWQSSSISNILANPIYMGLKAYGRTTTKGNRGKKGQWRKSPEDWIIPDEPNPDWVIVPENVWKQAQALKVQRLAEQKKQEEHNSKIETHRTWGYLHFIGYINCGCCGAAMVTGYSGSRWTRQDGKQLKTGRPVYRCGAKASGKVGCESKSSYAIEVVEGVVIDEVRTYLDTLKNVELADELKKLQKENVAIEENIVKTLTKELNSSKKDIARLKSEVKKSLIGKSEYTPKLLNEMIEEEETISEKLTERLKQAEQALESKRLEHEHLLQLQELIPIWSEEFDKADRDQQKVLLAKVVERVTVYPDHIDVKLRIQIENFLKAAENPTPPTDDVGGRYISSNGRPDRYR